MRIKLFYLLSPQSTINNISGVMLNNSDPNSIPQRPAQWVDKSNYLCGYFKLSLTYSLICTCRGHDIGKLDLAFNNVKPKDRYFVLD